MTSAYCPANGESSPIGEYFLNTTSPSLSVKISSGSPSRIRMVRRISLGITTRPRSSILLTIPVAFISKIPFFHNTLFPSIFYAGNACRNFPLPAINGKSSICPNEIFIRPPPSIFRVENHHNRKHLENVSFNAILVRLWQAHDNLRQSTPSFRYIVKHLNGAHPVSCQLPIPVSVILICSAAGIILPVLPLDSKIHGMPKYRTVINKRMIFAVFSANIRP